MLRKNRVLFIGVVCVALFVAFTFSPLLTSPVGAAGKPIVLKFAHQNPPKASTTVRFFNPWAKKVGEATKGRVKIVQYPAQSLVKARETITAVEGGIADIGWAPMGYFPGRFPLTDVMTLPFLNLPGAVKNSRILQELYETTPAMQKHFSSVKLLFMHTTDPYPLLTTKKPVINLNDLKGMKIRVLGTNQSDTFKRLGAAPLFMPMPGTYEAAEKGVIDAAVMPWAAVAGFRLWEVFHYWTDIPVFLGTFLMIMNLDTWNSLPPSVQKDVMSVSGVHGAEFAARTAFAPEVYNGIVVRAKAKGKKLNRVVLDEGEFEKWRKIGGKPVWDTWIKKMEAKGLPGKAVFDKAVKLMKKYE